MSQAEFLRQFDAAAFGAFAEAGIGDAASYLAPSDPPDALGRPCTVLVDREVRDFGDDLAPVSAGATLVTLQRAEIALPASAGRVALLDAFGVATGEVFELVRRVRQDESATTWEVAHVTA